MTRYDELCFRGQSRSVEHSNVVKHMNTVAMISQVQGCGQRVRPVTSVHIAPNHKHRTNLGERSNDPRMADVARMNDSIALHQMRQNLRPDEPVSV